MASTRTRYRSYERKLLLQFSLVGLGATLGVAAVLGYVMQRQLVDDALHTATQVAEAQVTSVVRPSLIATDIASPLPAALHARIDAIALRSFQDSGIVRIKIWNRDGVIVYSDDDAAIGHRQAADAGLDEALLGVTTAQITDLAGSEHASERKWGTLLEIYIPLRAIGSSRIVGAYEVYHTTTTLDQHVSEIRRGVAFGVFGGFGVLYFALLGTVLGAARRLLERTRENRRLTEEVTSAYDDAIEGWGRALDLKDHETEGHSQRVTDVAVEMARKLEMSPAEVVEVRRGALLHDIGKMGVPDEILKKPGALTEEEWVAMRAHTIYARDMLRGLGYLDRALDIPVHHHERWDGAGYPDALAGLDIPRAARLFAVVDVWDALTNDRPYRAAWSAEKALAHIQEGAGSHFDPEAVRTFLDVMRDRAAETVEASAPPSV